MVTRNPTWVQQNYQWYDDDAASSALANADTSVQLLDSRTTAFRLRANFGDTNNANTNNVRSVKLQVSVNGGAYADVTTTGKVIESVDANGRADGSNDGLQNLATIAGSAFQSAWTEFDEDNVTTSRTWGDTYTEYDFCLKLNGAVAGDSFTFRIVTSSNEIPTITNTPTMSVIAAPTFVGYNHGVIF